MSPFTSNWSNLLLCCTVCHSSMAKQKVSLPQLLEELTLQMCLCVSSFGDSQSQKGDVCEWGVSHLPFQQAVVSTTLLKRLWFGSPFLIFLHFNYFCPESRKWKVIFSKAKYVNQNQFCSICRPCIPLTFVFCQGWFFLFYICEFDRHMCGHLIKEELFRCIFILAELLQLLAAKRHPIPFVFWRK